MLLQACMHTLLQAARCQVLSDGRAVAGVCWKTAAAQAIAASLTPHFAPAALPACPSRSYLTPNTTQQGLLAVPCVIGQLAQIFMGAAFAPHLARVVTRREKLAALAATEVPDPEAEAAADAAAAAEAGEMGSDKPEEGSNRGCGSSSGTGHGDSNGDSLEGEGKGGGDADDAGPGKAASAGGAGAAAAAAR